MKFLTMQEFETIKVYELNNVIYNKIESAFIKALGEKLGKRILNKYLEKTLRELTCQSYVDIMNCLTIL